MFCPNCGKEIPDNSRFCGFCGSAVEPEPAGEMIGYNAVGWVDPAPKGGKKNGKRIIAVVAVVLVVALVVVGAVKLLSGGMGSGSSAYSCVWVSNGRYEFAKNILADEVESAEIASFSSDLYYGYDYDYDEASVLSRNIAKFSSDGKYLYYFSRITDYGFGTLYRVETGSLKAGREPDDDDIVKISSDVYLYVYIVLDDGSILYLQGNSYEDTYRLCWFDGEESTTIAKNVKSFQYEDEIVFYTREQDDYGSYMLYGQKLGDEDSTVKLASDISQFSVKGAENVLYTKVSEDEDSDETVYALYRGGYSAEAEKIADEVVNCTLFSSIEEKAGFFYTTQEGRTLTLGDYVDNPNATSDAAAVEPDYYDSKYEKEVTKTNSWTGNTYTTTERDTDAYYADRDAYNESQDRLELMEELQDSTYTDYIYSLYYYDTDSGESTLICDQIDKGSVSASTSISGSVAGAVYLKKADTVEKMDINDVIHDDDYYSFSSAESIVSDYISDNAADHDTIYFTIKGGKEQSLSAEALGFDEELNDLDFVLYEDGKKAAIFGTSYDEETYETSYGDVYTASVSGSAIGTFSDLSANEPQYIISYNDELYYASDSDLYLCRNDDQILMLEDEGDSGYGATWYTDGTILGLDDYDESYGGTLKLVNAKGEIEKIADDVTSYRMLDNDNILMLIDGDLRLYDGKDTVRIASDVDGYWCLNSKEIVRATIF